MRLFTLMTVILSLVIPFKVISVPQTLVFACSAGASERPTSLLMKDLTRIIVEHAGYSVEFVEYPWARVVALVKSGAIHGSYCFSQSKDRTTWIEFMDKPFLVSKVGLYKKKSNSLRFNNIQQLLELKIGVHVESFSATTLLALGASNLIYTHNDESLCRLLLGGRVDLIVSNPGHRNSSLCPLIKNSTSASFMSEIVNIGPPLALEHQLLGVGRNIDKHKEIILSLNQAYREQRKRGRLKTIYQRYQFSIPQ